MRASKHAATGGFTGILQQWSGSGIGGQKKSRGPHFESHFVDPSPTRKYV